MTDGERRTGKARDQVGGELCASVSERGRNRREGKGARREWEGAMCGWMERREKKERERESHQREGERREGKQRKVREPMDERRTR